MLNSCHIIVQTHAVHDGGLSALNTHTKDRFVTVINIVLIKDSHVPATCETLLVVAPNTVTSDRKNQDV